ncbi:hypothetical protein ACPCHT_38000 [Nucisporomicrobium flavum]|jgi:hypothetical protein|uniref:hypothetical protein n=1 Tax=Nucisporomicrobium flavum TaxID=2785915 RepID=UPI0018F2BF1B|nr:hypothetical protein [Nucisporomicrobium flavum]
MGRRRTWGWGLGIATVTAVTAFGVASWHANAAPSPNPAPGAAGEQPRVSNPDPGPEPAAGVGRDGLTSGEVDRARELAVTPELAAGAEDVTGAKGPEYLSADVLADGGGRRAELYYYDYKTDKLVKQVVDLKAGKLAGSYSAAGMQRPASEREVATALDMLLADPLASELKDAYQKATGKQFAGKDGLTVKAHVYKARPADTSAAQCGKHRCLQLVVETGDGLFIDVNDIIIDLSGRTVARLK